MPDPTTQRDAILASLERMLAWPEITRSPRLGRFLDYIVQRTLAGDEHSIKAYSIAVDVLGRPVDFDPQADPIVRVQARRLRGLIEDYYSGPGRDDPVRISLPVGRYVPEFRAVETATTGVRALAGLPSVVAATGRARLAGGLAMSWFAVAVLALGMGVIGFALIIFGPLSAPASPGVGQLPQPSVTVVEFQNLVGVERGAPRVAGLAIELVTDLDQFEEIDVRYGGGADMTIADDGDRASDYVLTGIVRRDVNLVQYSAILTDSRKGGVVWNYTVAVPAGEAAQAGVLDTVSRRLSLVLGSPRGPLHSAARQLLAQPDGLDDNGNLYLCRMLFHLYRADGAAIAAAQANACLAGLVQTDRESPTGLAMAASLLAEQDLGTSARDTAYAERLRLAQASLDRAITLAPVSAFIWEQHARLRQQRGQFDQARTDYGSAIQLNPANADALASYARLLAFTGDIGEAEAMARDAANGTPDPPDWYFGVPALLALQSGDYAEAITAAERYAQADHELGPILAIMGGQRRGDGDIVNRYLAQILDVSSFRERGVLPRLGERVRDKALLAQIEAALLTAGVPRKALNGPF